MHKQISQLEHKIGDRIFHLHFESNSLLGEIHDALSAMKLYIIEAMAKVERPPEEKAPKEGT